MAHSLETRLPFLDNDLVDFGMKLPEPLVKNIITLDNILLASAMFCMGLGISFSKIKEAGMKPIYLGLASAFQISFTSFIISYLIF